MESEEIDEKRSFEEYNYSLRHYLTNFASKTLSDSEIEDSQKVYVAKLVNTLKEEGERELFKKYGYFLNTHLIDFSKQILCNPKSNNSEKTYALNLLESVSSNTCLTMYKVEAERMSLKHNPRTTTMQSICPNVESFGYIRR